MSSSSARTVSVVIGSNAPPACLEACLEALEPQVDDGVEVLVYDGQGGATALGHRFPWARIVTAPGQLVPFHWRDGIDAATGEIVALTISQMQPAPDWIATIRAEHAERDVVGGAIDPGRSLRSRDWAEYFCRYTRDMRPFTPGPNADLPGDNATYRRSLLAGVSDAYRNGFWEPDVHRRLVDGGAVLWQEPRLVVRLGRSAGFTAFSRQRLEHGRAYGRQRGAARPAALNLAAIIATPLVIMLMTARIISRVTAKGRHRLELVAALPFVVAYNTVWAFAESVGYLDVLRGRS